MVVHQPRNVVYRVGVVGECDAEHGVGERLKILIAAAATEDRKATGAKGIEDLLEQKAMF